MTAMLVDSGATFGRPNRESKRAAFVGSESSGNPMAIAEIAEVGIVNLIDR